MVRKMENVKSSQCQLVLSSHHGWLNRPAHSHLPPSTGQWGIPIKVAARPALDMDLTAQPQEVIGHTLLQ